ncbi:type III secretion system chaperone family protein [Actinoalloteichus hymeniacidonis]|uniref:Secreted protein n=1 Tax=Actinoalloteichus hymeniacidonis TaxID=340345 RepID=A0AAC9HW04_9PSEU|nr:hypothetical protein [Actinoalloteichus hymeniacidonis]AOS66036.1 hypothetical protein TL08_26335 [Actinoalloteichus hymeniacidonis]MBB5905862.1 hypothetical protein [Actinoalloteichus hymeniacidonis]
MNVPTWVWFTVAVLFAVGGFVLLAADRAQRTARNRERRRWAALRGWQFAEVDQVLPTRWEHGALAPHGSGLAKDVVAGSTFTADGRRQVYVFDHETGGKISSVLIAVRCRRKHDVVVELWLPSVPVPQESGLDLLGPVGSRYAFVTNLNAARALMTPDLVEAAEEIGEDVVVVWLENEWVVAAAPPSATPARLEQLLRDVGEIADLVDPFDPDAEDADVTELPALEAASDAQDEQEQNEIYRPSN